MGDAGSQPNGSTGRSAVTRIVSGGHTGADHGSIAADKGKREGDGEAILNAGQTPALSSRGCSL